MKKSILFSVIISLFALASCEKTETEETRGIVGCWIIPQYIESNGENPVYQYQKASSFIENLPGIQFLSDGTLIERKNAGFCGTPPISYSNYAGYWQQENDSIINIGVDFWGGTEYKKWKIIDLTNTTLTIEILSQTTNNEK